MIFGKKVSEIQKKISSAIGSKFYFDFSSKKKIKFLISNSDLIFFFFDFFIEFLTPFFLPEQLEKWLFMEFLDIIIQ
jgi:hypothetical protein